MDKQYIAVQFRSDSDMGGGIFEGRQYTYCFDPEDGATIDVGDIICVPTKHGEGVARVCRTDVKESEIDERIMPYIRTISSVVRPKSDNED
jgi:hypothetical protein